MNIAVVFDTPYTDWTDDDFKRAVVAKEGEAEYEVAEALMAYDHDVSMVGVNADLQPMLDTLRRVQPDLVFNCAEGFRGHARLDYVFPALLESEGLKYTGSPPLSLLTTRNKALSKEVLAFHGIKTPRFATYRPHEAVGATPGLCFPAIVKPLQEDASEGIAQSSVVYDLEALAQRVRFVHESFAQAAIAEEFVEGRELYVSILGNDDELTVLPIVELTFDKEKTKPEERIATKHAKWNDQYRERKGIKNVFARPLSTLARDRIEQTCRQAFRALLLRDYARLDIRLTADDEVFVIEANANPFISFGHDMANSAEKAGLDYYAFVNRIVDEALHRYDHRA